MRHSMLKTAALALFAGGCVAQAGDEGAPGDELVGEAEAALWTVGSSVVDYHDWESYDDANSLSAWNDVTCASYGPNYMVTRLRVWREPSSNADNFVARMQARCTDFVDVGTRLAPTGTYTDELVYTGSYRSESGTVSLPHDYNLPIGINLFTSPGNNYVKNVAMVHGATQGDFLRGYSDQLDSGWAFSNFGMLDQERVVMCSDQRVLTGVGVRYDTRNGKIKRLRIYCALVSN